MRLSRETQEDVIVGCSMLALGILFILLAVNL